MHEHRDGVRGVIIDVDLQCTKSVAWVNAAGCLERGCALGYPGEETELRELRKWTTQPFYTVLPDLAHADESAAKGAWRWPWPVELASWEVNQYKDVPAALYLSEDALCRPLTILRTTILRPTILRPTILRPTIRRPTILRSPLWDDVPNAPQGPAIVAPTPTLCAARPPLAAPLSPRL